MKDLHSLDPVKVNNFWEFVILRHNAFIRKFVYQTEYPWTPDEIIQKVKFTNVYRILDRGTVFVIDKILPSVEMTNKSPISFLQNLLFYREFNYPPTHKFFAQTFGSGELNISGIEVHENLHLHQQVQEYVRNNKWRSNAYTVVGTIDKIIKRTQEWMKSEILQEVISSNDKKYAFDSLCKLYELGPFVAYEVISDYEYSGYHQWNASSWVNPGPGCERGIDLIINDNQTLQWPNEFILVVVWLWMNQREMLKNAEKSIRLKFPDELWRGKPLTLRDVEHSLCEYHKYIKAKNGGWIKTTQCMKIYPDDWYIQAVNKPFYIDQTIHEEFR